ncbi:MAG: hypothetical protein ACOY93_14375 [Bacillota bacterium]
MSRQVPGPARSTLMAGEERACRHTDYVEPEVGSRWILFLRPPTDSADLSAGAGLPWRFALRNGRAVPVPAVGDPFPVVEEAEFLEQITP